MAKAEINKPSPDFTLEDYSGNSVTLSDFKGDKNVLLVFNRGFFWPFCQKHMAQLRRSHDEFIARDTTVLVAGPDNAKKFANYFGEHNLPFIGMPDPKHSVLKLYGQQVKIFKLGRMPAQCLIDKKCIVRFVHYGHDMTDIPEPQEMITLIDSLDK